ncbi:hypothetical protein FI667_g16244, partial [Globisporangium splendens]
MYQQRRPAPAASAYESQAARWKQGFTTPNQQQRHSDLEAALVGELCSSVGSSSFPPRDVIQKLVRHLPNLDHDVQGKALSVLDAILKTADADFYKQHYYERAYLLEELCNSRKDIVKNRADKVFNIIKEYVPPAPAQPEYPSQESQQQPMYHPEQNNSMPQGYDNNLSYTQPRPQIDLLEEWEEPPLASSQDSVVPPTSAPSAFGFIGAGAPAAPQTSPAPVASPPAAAYPPSAPPMTESSFGFLNTPAAPAPQQQEAEVQQQPLSSTSRPHDRPLRVEDLATQSRGPSQPVHPAGVVRQADVPPTSSAFAFLAAPAPVTQVARPGDVWDALPAPTPMAVGVAPTKPEPVPEEKVHDPIHDAFEGLDADADSHPLDAVDNAPVSMDTPYPSAQAPEQPTQTSEPLREVILDIELPPGPMGLVLDRTISDMAVIERFIPLPSGDKGYLEMHPAICPGCALISINSVNVENKGLEEVGPVLAAFAAMPKVLRFKKLMNNGRTANPSTLLMPYIPPPPEEDEAKKASDEHMTRLTEFSESLDDIECQLDDIIRREQASIPIVDRKNQLAQLHGHVEKIQTQGIDSVILGPNPPPNFDEVKQFRSSLVRRADALTKRIQRTAEAPAAAAPVEPAATPGSPVSAFSFVSGTSSVNEEPVSLPGAAAPEGGSGFHFLNASPSTPPVASPVAASSGFSFMQQQEAANNTASSFAFLQNAPPTSTAMLPPVSEVSSVFAGLSVRDPSASAVNGASMMSAGPLSLSALALSSSASSSASTFAMSDPLQGARAPASSYSAFGFLSSASTDTDEDDDYVSNPAAVGGASSPTAFGFLNASTATSSSAASSAAATHPPATLPGSSAFSFISN